MIASTIGEIIARSRRDTFELRLKFVSYLDTYQVSYDKQAPLHQLCSYYLETKRQIRASNYAKITAYLRSQGVRPSSIPSRLVEQYRTALAVEKARLESLQFSHHLPPLYNVSPQIRKAYSQQQERAQWQRDQRKYLDLIA